MNVFYNEEGVVRLVNLHTQGALPVTVFAVLNQKRSLGIVLAREDSCP